MKALVNSPRSGREGLALACKAATWLLLLFVFAFSVVRAKRQAIAHDEAYTYVHHICGGIAQTLRFSPNNHVLFTWAAALLTRVFGLSEFTLRLPTLAGMIAYLVSSYFLCRRLFGVGIVLPIICSLLVTNPLVLDFLIAARGYGLGLAFLMLTAVIFVDLSTADSLRSHPNQWRWRCTVASMCLGLSVAANLSYLLPTISLAVVFAAVTVDNWRFSHEPYFTKLAHLICWLVLPGAAVALFILWPYLIQATRSSYQFGYPRLPVFLRELVDSSLLYKWTEETYANLGARGFIAGSWQKVISTWLSFIALPLLTLWIAAGFVSSLRKSPISDRSSQRTWCQLFSGATIGCVCLLVVLHLVIHDDYPVIRGCLYLIPLYTVSAALIACEVAPRVPAAVRLVSLCVMVMIATDYLLSLQASTFRYNVYDARSREAFVTILKDSEARGLKDVRIGGTWWYEPEFNFYRLVYKAKQIRMYEQTEPSAPFIPQRQLRATDYDYVCFTSDNKPDLRNVGWRVVFHDDKTDMTIAAIER